MENFPVQVTVASTATISRRELAYALMQEIRSLTGVDDDAGCDWLTSPLAFWENDKQYRETCIGSPAWVVSKNVQVAALVDAYNILTVGEILNGEYTPENDDHD